MLAPLAPHVHAQRADSAEARPAPASAAAGAPRRILAIWTAGASDQALSTRLGWRHDRGLFMLGIERGWLLRSSAGGSRSLYYLAGLLPYATSSGMPTYSTTRVRQCSGRVCETRDVTQMQSKIVHALGVMPVGLAASFRLTDRVGTRVRGGAGVLVFGEPIPDPLARRANLSFDLGATLDVRLMHRVTVTGGMRVNHISNAYTGRVNPGMNSVMPEIGVVVGR